MSTATGSPVESEAERKIRDLQAQLAGARSELEGLRTSRSYRLGQALSEPYRVLRRALGNDARVLEVVRRAARRLARPSSRVKPTGQLPVARGGTVFEAVTLDASGLIRVMGRASDLTTLRGLQLELSGKPLRALSTYRLYRPELPDSQRRSTRYLGFAMEFILDRSAVGELQLLDRDRELIWSRPVTVEVRAPDYKTLFDEERVLHRDQIYGYGPPCATVSPEIGGLVVSAQGPVLDWGCGGGALIKFLLARGTEARGLELDRPEIRAALTDDVAGRITLYGGSLPSPFPDRSFATVTCFEVLEHVEPFEDALADMARLAREELILSVPELSAIPLGHRHLVVPWHLLESTHVNFFTQKSLERLLRRHYERIEFARIGPVTINGTTFFTSVVARCRATARAPLTG
jgi:SAM-dependent methyltransferase